MQLPIDDINLLDKIIDSIFARYQIMNLAHVNNLYINDELQQKIIKEVFETVYISISDTVIDKLSLVYNREYIDDVIAQKVQMIVLNYTIEINGNYKDSKK